MDFNTFFLMWAAIAVAKKTGGYLLETMLGGSIEHFTGKGLDSISGRIKALLHSDQQKLGVNSDLVKVLKISMLRSTQIVRESMKGKREEKSFRSNLKRWVQSKIISIDDHQNWPSWEIQDGTAEILGLLSTDNKSFIENKSDVVVKMIIHWCDFIKEDMAVELPAAFVDRMINEFQLDGKMISWPDLVIQNFFTFLSEEKDQLAVRAKADFINSFLVDIDVNVQATRKSVVNIESKVDEVLLTLSSSQTSVDTLASVVKMQQQTIERLNKELIDALIANSQKQKEHLQEQLKKNEERLEEFVDQNETLKTEYQGMYKNILNRLEQEGKTNSVKLTAAELIKQGKFGQAKALRMQEVAKQVSDIQNVATTVAEECFQLALDSMDTFQYADAFIMYEKAVELDPNNVQYLHHLGQFLDFIAGLDQMFLKIASVSPKPRTVKSVDGKTKLVTKNSINATFDRAIAVFQRKISVLANSGQANTEENLKTYFSIGESYAGLKDVDNAISYFDNAIAMANILYGDGERETLEYYYRAARCGYNSLVPEISTRYYNELIEIVERNYPNEFESYKAQYYCGLAIAYDTLWARKKNDKILYENAVGNYQRSIELSMKSDKGDSMTALAARTHLRAIMAEFKNAKAKKNKKNKS